MYHSSLFSRRHFAKCTLGAALGTWGGLPPLHSALAAEDSQTGPPLRIYKAVKWGMIRGADSAIEKFQICRELGYSGMELVSPTRLTASEIRQASDATGMPVHGVVNMKHWNVRLSDPDPAVRNQGVDMLMMALRNCKKFGGDSVLLVPGKVTGKDENHDHVWNRSIAGIRQALPVASRLGVRILIENVWNGFCESPEEFRDYLDEIASPWVGAYFDIGNAWKFQPSQDWIRTLGSRIVKLDVKGWGKQAGFGRIGDGDIQWDEVRKALKDIGFNGWATAEVAGGERERLIDIKIRMDQVLD